MKSQTEEQKTTETKKPRFKIEKLEERIAPCHSWRYNVHAGKYVGHYGRGGCR